MIPNLLIEYIKKSVFKYEFDMLSKMVGDSEDKRKYRNLINERFNSYLYDFSNKTIKPFREKELENGVIDYSYIWNRKQLITMRLDKADGDDGNKRGGLYTSFSVTMSGWMEYANPISFMTQVPAIIRGRKNDYFIQLSSTTNYKGDTNLMKFKEIIKDERQLVRIDKSRWKKFYTEYEIMMTSSVENFNILDDVIDVEDTPSSYYIMAALLDQVNTIEDFNNLFTVHIYKENRAISRNLYDIDKKFNITIRECDTMVPYYIDIFVNIALYQKYFEKIIKILYECGLLLDKDGLFTIGRLRNITQAELYEWITKYMIRSKYTGGYSSVNGQLVPKSKHFIYVNDEYYWKYAHRRGWHYLTKNLENNTFVPIKTEDFCIASPEYQYYTLSVKREFIPVTDEVVEVRDDLQFYVKYGNEFYTIDRNEVLIPDPKYEFYIFDREKMKFALCVNIEKFEKGTQYYILRDQHKTNSVEVNEYQ
jgi:hypothetical protein